MHMYILAHKTTQRKRGKKEIVRAHMRTCARVCVNVCVTESTCAHAHTGQIFIHTMVFNATCVFLHAHTRILQINTRTQAHSKTHSLSRSHKHNQTLTQTHTNTHTHAYTHTLTHTNMYTHGHAFVRVCVNVQELAEFDLGPEQVELAS